MDSGFSLAEDYKEEVSVLLASLRSHSLRAHLDIGVGGLFIVATVSAAILQYHALDLQEAEGAAKVRVLSRGRAQMALYLSLLSGEAGLRSYVATKDPRFLISYKEGVRTEQEAWRNFMDNLGPGDEEAAMTHIARLKGRVQAWHEEVATPITRTSPDGKVGGMVRFLEVERVRLEDIHAASDALVRFLDQRDEERIVNLEKQRVAGKWRSLVGLTVMVAAMVGLIRWLLWRIAKPLTELSDRAWQGLRFEEPSHHPVREVDILARALYDLDQRVLDREHTLLREREDALAVQAFSDLVQQLSAESDLLAALRQALDRLVAPDEIRILLRPVREEGLQWVGQETVEVEHRVLSDPSYCRALRTGGAVCFWARSAAACLCSLGVPERGAYLCLPLVAAGQPLGLVNLQSALPNHWTQERRQTAAACVSVAASALQTIRALALAQEQAVRDPLTGVFNRRLLNEVLTKLLSQARRNGRSLSLALFDIDHFKRFNDRFGHETGDRVLVAFAHFIRDKVRTGDVVARFGGEEFVLLLPDTDHSEAMQLAERLRQGVEGLVLSDEPWPDSCRISVSAGVSTYPGHAQHEDALIDAADKALYLAKGQGRNQIRSASEL